VAGAAKEVVAARIRVGFSNKQFNRDIRGRGMNQNSYRTMSAGSRWLAGLAWLVAGKVFGG